MPSPKRTLEQETELLVKKIVRAASRKRQITGADGTVRFVDPDISEQVKAAQLAKDWLVAKAQKLNDGDDDKENESEFDRALRDFHGTAEGDAPARPNGTGGRH